MRIDKNVVLDLLKQQGKHEDAAAAAKELPATVDSEQHAGLLSKYGLDINDLLAKLPGGLGDKVDELPGGLGKKLKGLL